MSKTIAIVGAGPGVGLAVAERFGREGFNVALLARNLQRLERMARELFAKGIEAKAFAADMLDRPGLRVALEAAAAAASHDFVCHRPILREAERRSTRNG